MPWDGQLYRKTKFVREFVNEDLTFSPVLERKTKFYRFQEGAFVTQKIQGDLFRSCLYPRFQEADWDIATGDVEAELVILRTVEGELDWDSGVVARVVTYKRSFLNEQLTFSTYLKRYASQHRTIEGDLDFDHYLNRKAKYFRAVDGILPDGWLDGLLEGIVKIYRDITGVLTSWIEGDLGAIVKFKRTVKGEIDLDNTRFDRWVSLHRNIEGLQAANKWDGVVDWDWLLIEEDITGVLENWDGKTYRTVTFKDRPKGEFDASGVAARKVLYKRSIKDNTLDFEGSGLAQAAHIMFRDIEGAIPTTAWSGDVTFELNPEPPPPIGERRLKGETGPYGFGPIDSDEAPISE